MGRGPLAGDVVTAAVILPENHQIEGLADSKSLSARQRENLYDDIVGQAECWCVGRASVEEIDRQEKHGESLLSLYGGLYALH